MGVGETGERKEPVVKKKQIIKRPQKIEQRVEIKNHSWASAVFFQGFKIFRVFQGYPKTTLNSPKALKDTKKYKF